MPDQLTVNFSSTALLEQIPSFILALDRRSNFIYANKYAVKMNGFDTLDQMIGINAHAIRCPAVESAHDFIAQDRCVLETNMPLTILDSHIYANGISKIFLTTKTPYCQEKKVIGTICQCMEVHSTTLQNLCNNLLTSDQRYKKNKRTGGSYTAGLINQENILTPREKDCLFYLLRGRTMKQIAECLAIGPRTVESYLENMKAKLGCNKKSELIAYGITEGYLSYIPEELLKQNTSIVL